MSHAFRQLRKFFGVIGGMLLVWPSVSSQTPKPAPAPAPNGVTFTDITKAAGITFINIASPDKKYIVESMGGPQRACQVNVYIGCQSAFGMICWPPMNIEH